MKKEIISQKHKVLEHLIRQGDITRAYALSVYTAQALAQIIHELRHRHGLTIKTKIHGLENGMNIAVYELPYYEKARAKEVLAGV